MEGSWRPNKDCNILTPPPKSSGYHSLSFPFSWAAQPGAWGPSLSWDRVLIPASSLRMIWTSWHRGYIIIWRPSNFYERHNSHSIQPLDNQGLPLISSTGCICYLHRCVSFFDNLTGVNMQQYAIKPNQTKSYTFNIYVSKDLSLKLTRVDMA